MSIEVNVKGQTILINEFSNLIRINIDSAFQDPSYRMPQWDFRCSGFGINQEIIDILEEKKMRLYVHEGESNKNFLLEYDQLRYLLNSHNLDYVVKETKLKILPKSFFKEL